ncbi:MAG: PLDc N-terminal domain-containing protein [Chloroflexota bacterium]
MSKSKVFWTGLASFLPLILVIVMLFFMINYISDIITLSSQAEISGGSEPPEFILAWVKNFMYLSIILTVISIASLIYFIYDVFHNKHVEQRYQVAWLLVILLASVVGFPIYWFMNIFKYRNEPEVI